MANIGALSVKIGADTSDLKKGLSESGRMLDGFGKQAKVAATAIAALGTAAVAAGAAMLIHLVKSGLEVIDHQAKLSRRIGGSIDALRGLQIAASDAGISQENLATSIEMLNVRLGEAALGTGEGARSLERLGLSAKELGALDVDERVAVIADKIKEMSLSTQQAAYEMRSLGIRSREIVGLMMEGGDAIRAARSEVAQFGLSLSAVDARKVEMANDAMSRIKLTLESIRNAITIRLAPIFKTLADQLNATAKANKGWGDQAGMALEKTIIYTAKLIDIVEGLKRTFMVAGRAIVGILSTVEIGLLHMADVIINGPTRVLNELIKLFNKIPGHLKIPEFELTGIGKSIQEEMKLAGFTAAEAFKDIADILSQPLPSTGIEAWLAEVRKKSEDAAKAIETASTGGAGGKGGAIPINLEAIDEQLRDFFGALDESESDYWNKKMERLQTGLETLRDSLKSELELEASQYEEKLAALEEYYENKLVTEEDYNELLLGLAAEHEENITRIKAEEANKREEIERRTQDAIARQRQGALSLMVGFLETLGQKSKIAAQAALVLNTALSIASAIQNTAVAATRALAELGPIAGPPMAAKITAWGYAQVALIAAQGVLKFATMSKGGTGMPSPTTSGAGQTQIAGAPARGGGGTYTVIHLEGETFGRQQIRDLIEQINEGLSDGSQLRLA